MVNFLDLIWLIPLFPLAGAGLMLFFGRKLDPQPRSQVAAAPGLEVAHDPGHGHDHAHGHGHDHTHPHGHDHTHDHAHGHSHSHSAAGAKFLV
ncbi:MAG: hypothetical protein FJX76_26100, partial [Armatimonadetes bacterium]|nr:hypothetical protein [Armatimonadota bacterium]